MKARQDRLAPSLGTNTIRRRLTASFLILSTIPLVVMGVLFARLSFNVQYERSLDAERRLARQGVSLLDGFFERLEDGFAATGDAVTPWTMAPAGARTALSRLMARRRALDDAALVDTFGREVARVSRRELSRPSSASWQSAPLFASALGTRETAYGAVVFDSLTGEPSMLVAAPLVDLATDLPRAVLVARIGLKNIWDIVSELPTQPGESLYVVDDNNAVVAHTDPSVVLRGTRHVLPAEDGITDGLLGPKVVMARQAVPLGGRKLTVVAEQNVQEALGLGLQSIRITVAVSAVALLVALFLASLVVRTLLKPIDDMAETAQAISNGDLDRRVSVVPRDELGVLALALNRMAGQLQDQLRGLERRVAERTVELEEANRQLESFSYSVSHDLRAPLRAIRGFTSMLIEEESAHLPPQSLRWLNLVFDNCRQMGDLIEGLLAFSRLGRHAIIRVPVDTVRLVAEVVETIQAGQQTRPIVFTVGELLPCEGDILLLREVWTNLIANAVKFTAGRDPAYIEVGSRAGKGGTTIYWVKDNGVGFDMRYADKLFGVFQRLHDPRDFEGTGVGLAITQRIVTRHGGKIWAQAEVENGATFSFTLEGEA